MTQFALFEAENQTNFFSKKYSFSCYQQTSPLGVHGYTKTKDLAQPADSKAFFYFIGKAKAV